MRLLKEKSHILAMVAAVCAITILCIVNLIKDTAAAVPYKFDGTSGEDCMIFGRWLQCDAAGMNCTALGFGVCVQSLFDCGRPDLYDSSSSGYVTTSHDVYEINGKGDDDTIRFANGIEECGSNATGIIKIDQNIGSTWDYDDIIIKGSNGNDYLLCCANSAGTDCWNTMGDCTVFGGNNNDIICGSAKGDPTLDGGSGIDNIRGNGGDDTIQGGSGDDILYGNDGADTIDGEQHDDIIEGGNGDDTIYGGDGVDVILGGVGEDYLYGEDGEDEIYGEEDNDCICGGDDNDTVLHGERPTLDDGTCNYIDGGGSGGTIYCGCDDPGCPFTIVGKSINGTLNWRCGAIPGDCGCPACP